VSLPCVARLHPLYSLRATLRFSRRPVHPEPLLTGPDGLCVVETPAFLEEPETSFATLVPRPGGGLRLPGWIGSTRGAQRFPLGGGDHYFFFCRGPSWLTRRNLNCGSRVGLGLG